VSRRPLVAGALAVVAVGTTGLLAACSAGQQAQTSEIRPGVAGVNLSAPDGRRVYVRNIAVTYPGPTGYPKGGAAPLQMWIFNDTQQTITLTAVNGAEVHEASGTNDAEPCSVPRSIAPSAPSSVTAPSVSPSVSTSPSASASKPAKPSAPAKSGAPSASPSESPSGSPSPSPSPTLGSATIKVAVPAGGCVELSPRAANYLALVELPVTVDSTTLVPVWFSFRSDDGSTFEIGSAGDPVRVPVAVPDSPLPRES
jgi:hypothetical protein